MYKRRDWLLTHGPDGGGDDTSSDESSDDVSIDDDSATSSDNDDDVNSSDAADSDGAVSQQSEEDEESGSDDEDDSKEAEMDARYQQSIDDDKQLSIQLKSWKQGKSKPDFLPVSCLACHGNLLLNPTTYNQHNNSSKHKRKLDAFKERNQMVYDTYTSLPYCYARQKDYFIAHIVQLQEDTNALVDDGETHEERLARVDRILAEVKKKNEGKNTSTGTGRKKKDNDSDDSSDSDSSDDDGGVGLRRKKATATVNKKKQRVDKGAVGASNGKESGDQAKKRGKKGQRKTRPGKRQRQAMKEQRQEVNDGE